MPHSLTLQINLENFNRFKHNFLLSSVQKQILQEFKKTNNVLSELKKKDSFSFTDSNEFHISRGDTYAITESLQERFDQEVSRLNDLHTTLEQKRICLNDLHTALEQKNNSLDDLLAALEQVNINLDDLFAVLKEKEINLEDLKAALKLKGISLDDLQKVLKEDYQISDEKIRSFIISCLVEPTWLPGTLGVIDNLILHAIGYRCCNQAVNNTNQRALNIDRSDSQFMNFLFTLDIKNLDNNLIKGSVTNYFSISTTLPLQAQLSSITMQFNFSNEREFKQFQKKFAKNFEGWLLQQSECAYIPIKLADWRAIQIDFWVLSISIGLLMGLSAMISLIALGLTPISPVLLPPIGFALGLVLASFINSYIQMNIKKEQEKIQRPIHLFNETSIPSTSFFNLPRLDNASIGTDRPYGLNK